MEHVTNVQACMLVTYRAIRY